VRIAQLVSARVLNGAARHCLALSAALADRGHNVLLVQRPGLEPRLEHPRVEVVTSQFHRSPMAVAALEQTLAGFGAEVLHTHMSSAHSYGALLRVWRGAPLVATAHARHFQLHWMFNDRVIAPSRSTAAYHRRVNLPFGPKIEVIPNFVDCAAIQPSTPELRRAARRRLGLDEDALVIGSVADITANKRPSDLVRAARPVLELRPDAVLLLVGAVLDAEEAIRVRREAGDLDHRVRLLGRRQDAHELLAALDIFGLASQSEEAPMSLLEAMAAGLPVVATDVGGVSELVSSGETGFLVAARNTQAFGERLARLAGDPELRSRLGQAGRERALAEFSAGPIVERIEAVLAAAAGRRPGWRWRAGAPADGYPPSSRAVSAAAARRSPR
jgi:glycosyltransferase involved in cell wall biosynthesis